MTKSAINSTWTDGYLTADVLTFGNFYIGIDTLLLLYLQMDLTPGQT